MLIAKLITNLARYRFPADFRPKLKALISSELDQPLASVAITVDAGAECLYGLDQAESCVFLKLLSIGKLDSNVHLTQAICQLLERELGVPPARVIIRFEYPHEGGSSSLGSLSPVTGSTIGLNRRSGKAQSSPTDSHRQSSSRSRTQNNQRRIEDAPEFQSSSNDEETIRTATTDVIFPDSELNTPRLSAPSDRRHRILSEVGNQSPREQQHRNARERQGAADDPPYQPPSSPFATNVPRTSGQISNRANSQPATNTNPRIVNNVRVSGNVYVYQLWRDWA